MSFVEKCQLTLQQKTTAIFKAIEKYCFAIKKISLQINPKYHRVSEMYGKE